MVRIAFIPADEFRRVQSAQADGDSRLTVLADMCRVNTLSAVKRAGSGHLGSSFSAMDIVVWLYYRHLNTLSVGLDSPDRDVYFSSKGHDVPGLYSVLFSLGVLPLEKLLSLRRLGGLDGHPDVGIRGIEANSGSLGMGISKARGIAWAKRLNGHGGRVIVMTGDGELQEGQNYEALQTARHMDLTNLTIIVDHNKLQSDKEVCVIIDLGNLEDKFASFGWHVARCNGHDFAALEAVWAELEAVHDRPKVILADTIKGRGISFMEHPAALREGHGLYRWHAGAPPDEAFAAGQQELLVRIEAQLTRLGLAPLDLTWPAPELTSSAPVNSLAGEPESRGGRPQPAPAVSDEYVANAFGEALVEIGGRRTDLVVLDGDLAADCRIRSFELKYPDRFIENGIAEQDMVSMAGGLARQGLLPVVNSFASFLSARANEQIYNNTCEQSRIIYVCHYAGLIPAGPGRSHQSIRDISLFGALPGLVMLQPCNALETRLALDYCVNRATENCMLRLIIGPSPRLLQLPPNYALTPGQGVGLSAGNDAVLFAYGPVMLHEALLASEQLAPQAFGLRVINMPWLNRVDLGWLAREVRDTVQIYVLEDHATVGGLGDFMLNQLTNSGLIQGRRFSKFGVEGLAACGTPQQALRFHKLDAASLIERILDSGRDGE